MSGKFFLDTNIFIYSFDSKQIKKANIAKELIKSAIQSGDGYISYQVINEFSNVALKKFKPTFTHDELKLYFLKILKPLYLVTWSTELFLKAMEVSKKTHYSFYDSLIISSAIFSGSDTLFTEDLSDNQKVEGVRIVNPF